MRLLPQSPPSGRLPKPASWSRALLAISLIASCITTIVRAQTAPTPLTLPVSQDFGASSFTTLPAGFAAWNGLNGGNVSTQTLAENSAPTGNATLTAATAAQTTGAGYGYATGGDAKFYVQTSSNATNGVNQLAMGLNCSGRQDVTVGYTVDIISAQPRTIGVVCQYRVGSTGSWTTVTAGSGLNPYSQAGGSAGLKTTVSALLPAAVNNQAVVQVRWAIWRGTETGNSSGLAIDNVTVSSSPFGGTDTTPPAVTGLSPANNATAVAVGTNLVATFTENVAVGTGSIFIKKTSDNSTVATIPVADPSVTFSTNTVTINPASDLAVSTSYYVIIDSGAIKDTAGNNFAGITTSATWTFTTFTPDVTPPTVVSFTPTNGATNIQPPSSLKITFNEPVQIPLFSSATTTFVVKNAGGTPVATIDTSVAGGGADAVTIVGSVATIAIPSATPLEFGVSYYVEIGSAAFEDISGNQYAGITGNSSWAFSTVDVPGLAGSPYTQTFSTFVSAATLPAGWSTSGPTGYVADYQGDWGSVVPDLINVGATLGGLKGNASVFGYHHTSSSGTTSAPLVQILTLRNATAAAITDLTVTYKGRVNVLANTRIPVYTVSVAGVASSALGYSTNDGDNAQRNASVSGLSIPVGATFQIKWSSGYPSGAGSARQIGISDVMVSANSTLFPPTVASMSVPVATIGSINASVQADVISDGGQTVTARGFVYSVTSVNSSPQLAGTGVTSIADGSPSTGAYNTTLSGLSPATNYSVSGYATNTTGTTYSKVVTFTTLGASPTFVSSYTQEFSNITGTAIDGVTNMPAGWTAISDAVPPVQTYVGTWGTGSTNGGFLGGVTATPPTVPGVLGYRHTGATGTLTVSLRLINGTGAPLTSLNVSYLGRVFVPSVANDTRSPIWSVSVNGGTAVPALEYSTVDPAPGTLPTDQTKSALITGLNIASGAEFTISWKSDRGLSTNSSKQIGIAQVAISTTGTPPSGYTAWKAANAGGQGATLDFDNDGVSNGLEYFMGATGSTFTPNPGIVGGVITWPKDPAFVGTYTVQTSPDLVTWTNASSTVVGNTVQYTPATGAGKLFIRMQVVVTP